MQSTPHQKEVGRSEPAELVPTPTPKAVWDRLLGMGGGLLRSTIHPVVKRNSACKNVYKGVTPYKVQKLTRRKGKGVPVLLSEGPAVENGGVVF